MLSRAPNSRKCYPASSFYDMFVHRLHKFRPCANPEPYLVLAEAGAPPALPPASQTLLRSAAGNLQTCDNTACQLDPNTHEHGLWSELQVELIPHLLQNSCTLLNKVGSTSEYFAACACKPWHALTRPREPLWTPASSTGGQFSSGTRSLLGV